MAGRAVQRIIPDSFLPWREPDADVGFGCVNSAIHLAVICPEEERTVRHYAAISINPIVNEDNKWEVFRYKIPSVTTFPIRKCNGNMVKDILPVGTYPRDKIFNNPFLAPPPLLTACTAL